MKRAVLHIGTDGTGTSSIQRALHRDADLLARHSVHLLGCGRPAAEVAKTRVEWRRDQDETWDALADELRALEGTEGTIVLSNEMLWLQQPRVLYRLRGLLRDRHITVVFYVREQADYLQWRVLQAQKKREKSFDFRDPEAFDAFVGRRRLNYFETCRRFEKVFGRSSVAARMFDRSALVGGDVVSDFYHLLDVPLPTDEESSSWPAANPTLSADLAELLRVRRPALVKDYPFVDLVDVALRLSQAGVGQRYFLDQARVRRIQALHEQSNRRMAMRYLTNATELHANGVWATGDPPDLDELEHVLREAAGSAPRLGRGWSGEPGLATKLFDDGWAFDLGADGERVGARLTADAGTIRFRTSFQRQARVGSDGLRLVMETQGVSPASAGVSVDGIDLGRHELAEAPIPLRPTPDGRIATDVVLRRIDAAPPVVISALGVADPVH